MVLKTSTTPRATRGDELIKLVANRLTKTLTHTETVCRLGGDQCAFVGSADQIGSSSEPLIQALQEPFRIGGRTIEVGASIGTALLTSDIPDGYELLRRADMALYEAKESGRGRIVGYLGKLDLQRNQRAGNGRQAMLSGRKSRGPPGVLALGGRLDRVVAPG